MKIRALSLLLLWIMVLNGCQQEVDFPKDLISTGSLQNDATGNCLPKTINGTYIVGAGLTPNSNTVTVQLNVTRAGTYTVYTDTVNGYYFRSTGIFISTGNNTIIIKGSGTPLAAGANNFIVHYDTTACNIAVTVLPAGTTSMGTLGGAGGPCTGSTVNGIYTTGTVLTTGNTVSIQVNVTAPGSYTINTNTLTGFAFAASGNFVTTGVQSVLLAGVGTPTTAGVQVFTVTYGTGTCTFPVNVNGSVVSYNYLPSTINNYWVYEPVGLPPSYSDSFSTRVTPLTFSALGNTYKIFLDTWDDLIGPQYDSGYMRKSGGDYYTYADVGSNYGFNSSIWIEYISLKDDVAQGTVWYSPVFSGILQSQTVTMRQKNTIEQKDMPISITSTLGTTNYSNVIVVETHEEKLVGGIWVNTESPSVLSKSYYARDIGQIKSEILNTTQPLYETEQVLRRYQLN